MMSLLTIVRHGQSTYNLENRFTGKVNVPLTALGEKEAQLAGIKLRGFNYDIAYTSMLIRAKESLRIILEQIKLSKIPIVTNAAFDERMYGSLQGLNKTETENKYGTEQVNIWRRSYSVKPPNGESLEDTFNRTVPFYKLEIEPKLKTGKNILIVAHGNSLRGLMMYLENISPLSISEINIPTGLPRNYLMDKDLRILKVSYL